MLLSSLPLAVACKTDLKHFSLTITIPHNPALILPFHPFLIKFPITQEYTHIPLRNRVFLDNQIVEKKASIYNYCGLNIYRHYFFCSNP